MENFKLSEVSSWPALELLEKPVNQLYQVSENAPFFFRMQDNKNFIKEVQRLIKEDPSIAMAYTKQLEFVADIKTKYLWLKTESTLIKMSLFDIYHGLMMNFKDSSFEDQLFNVNEVSFIGPLGPFKEMSLIECLNTSIIERLVFDHVVRNKLPMRNMRVHTKSKIYMEFGQEFSESAELELRQITDTGLLFSSNDDLILELLTHGEYVKVFMDTRKLNDFVENDLQTSERLDDKFFYTKDDLRYFFLHEPAIVKSLSYDSGDTSEVFLFVRYNQMLETDVPNIFHSFLEKMKAYFASL